MRLFNIKNGVSEIKGKTVLLERHLQSTIENHMQELFAVTFLRSEYVIDGGRIDSIGIDENNCPVIFEYKRTINENVINQGLFYLDWLLGHKDSFKVLVLESLGIERANEIDWTMPRVVCVAGDFNKYDMNAINQINRNISLVRYKLFGEDILMFEYLNQSNSKPIKEKEKVGKESKKAKTESDDTVSQFDIELGKADKQMQDLYNSLRERIMLVGDEVVEMPLKRYIAFRKAKNFACITQVSQKRILVTLNLNPKDIALQEGFSRDVSGIGHWGTGNVQVEIKNEKDIELAMPLITLASKDN